MAAKRIFVFLTAVLTLGTLSPHIAAEMSSTNYRVTASVVSGGGGFLSSENYSSDQTTGQPSPLMNPYDPPFSMSYDFYPGYWYAVAGVNFCQADLDGDSDVDGKDIHEYISGTPSIGVNVLAEELGRVGCPAF